MPRNKSIEIRPAIHRLLSLTSQIRGWEDEITIHEARLLSMGIRDDSKENSAKRRRINLHILSGKEKLAICQQARLIIIDMISTKEGEELKMIVNLIVMWLLENDRTHRYWKQLSMQFKEVICEFICGSDSHEELFMILGYVHDYLLNI